MTATRVFWSLCWGRLFMEAPKIPTPQVQEPNLGHRGAGPEPHFHSSWGVRYEFLLLGNLVALGPHMDSCPPWASFGWDTH